MSVRRVPIEGKTQKGIGTGEAVYIIGEIGINHNGSLKTAKSLIDGALFAGCQAVKFQKRTPEICVPLNQWNKERETPWGRMTYIEYRHRMELGHNEFQQIANYCHEKGMDWFASCWDEPSIEFMEHFNPPLYKVASACLTDHGLLKKLRLTGRPIMLSTGMSTLTEIEDAVKHLDQDRLLLAHATSAYPCSLEELNLAMIETLKRIYPHVPIGYSGHETGLAPTLAAVALGACFIERHITLDRAMWGSDQAASVEIMGMHKLVRDIRDIERALGDGIKRVYNSEKEPMKRLRRTSCP